MLKTKINALYSQLLNWCVSTQEKIAFAKESQKHFKITKIYKND